MTGRIRLEVAPVDCSRRRSPSCFLLRPPTLKMQCATRVLLIHMSEGSDSLCISISTAAARPYQLKQSEEEALAALVKARCTLDAFEPALKILDHASLESLEPWTLSQVSLATSVASCAFCCRNPKWRSPLIYCCRKKEARRSECSHFSLHKVR